MIPLHFVVKFLNLAMSSFIALQGLSSPDITHNRTLLLDTQNTNSIASGRVERVVD